MQAFVLPGTEILLGLLLAAALGATIGFFVRGWYDTRTRLRRRRLVAEMREAAREQVGGATTSTQERRRPATARATPRSSARSWARREDAPAAAAAAEAVGSVRGEVPELPEGGRAAVAGPVPGEKVAGGQAVAAATVLLVDDRLELLAVHSAYLHRAGYRVMTAADGDEALESARRHHPAVVVLDHSMPRRTGVEVARELKRDPSTADITILLMTAHSYGAIGASARAAGCAAFLPKPCDPSRLLKEVARHAPALAGGNA